MAWRGAICFPMSSTGKADTSTIVLRIHTDRPDDENDRCSALNLQSKPRRFSPLTHSYTATSIHVDTKWQPRPTARSGLMHSTTGGGRHVPGDEMMRASQPCGVPRRLTWINVTMPYYRVADEIPPVFRQAAQLADRPARENPAE